ncbi:transcriptional regulator [Verrucomicrobia bacterium LW23]|nr:transcriptional regulator [Verrucomicrobia bacterium LW23]
MKRKQPKHKKIEQQLRRLIVSLPAGARMPAERDLAVVYKCNFLTVRKALKILTDEGKIVRLIGNGTYVAKSAPSSGESAASGTARTATSVESGTSEGDTAAANFTRAVAQAVPSGNMTGRRLHEKIGIVVFSESDRYAFSVVHAITTAAAREGVELRLGWINDFGDNALRQIQKLADEGCRAAAVPWFPLQRSSEMHQLVQYSPIPLSLPLPLPGLEHRCFEVRELFGATMLSATEALCHYFALMGHRRIAFLGPSTPMDKMLQQKLSAYSCYLSREGLPTHAGLVQRGSRPMDELARQWKEFRGELAVVSYDDEHALRFLTAMHKLGLSAPIDFVIVGYNNTDASQFSDPPLSTVRQNFDYIGRWMLTCTRALAAGRIQQSTEAPSLDLLVRSTCGGTRDNLLLQKSMQSMNLNLCFEETAHSPATISAPLALPLQARVA